MNCGNGIEMLYGNFATNQPIFIMKKITYLFMSAMLMMFYACTEQEVQVGQPDDELSKSGKSNGPVLKVYPTGVDDTENLVQAFADAKASGPGAVVQLMEGEYFTSIIEVHDYVGMFKGAGKNKTFLTALPDLPCAQYFNSNTVSALIKFIAGDISVADMTITIPDGFACSDEEEPIYGRDLYAIVEFSDWSGTYMPANRFIKATVRNVDFYGGKDDGSGGSYWQMEWNTALGIWYGADVWWMADAPRTYADLTVEGCLFDYLADGFEALGCDGGKVNTANNTFKDCLWPVYFADNINTTIEVLNSTFINSTGYDVLIDEIDWSMFAYTPPTSRNKYNIVGNTFSNYDGIVNVQINDYRHVQYPDEGFPILNVIKNNKFNLGAGSVGVMCPSSHDAQIRNNQFVGYGDAGIVLDRIDKDFFGMILLGDYAENAMILGNNFRNATFDQAAVVLTEYTKNCTVIGGNIKDNIINEGLNNRIVNASLRKGPFKVQPHHSYNYPMAFRKP